jgi:RimJ/RimL family protein N-acetyltransferase
MYLMSLEDFKGRWGEANAELLDYASSLAYMGASVSVGESGGCITLLVSPRAESSFFSFPEPVSEDSDLELMLDEIFELCLIMELPMNFCDVKREQLPILLQGVRHADIDGDGENFNVRIRTECQLLEDAPEILAGRVYLGELVHAYGEDYKRLVTDKDHNRYSGEDVRFDMKDRPAEYFIDEARADLDRGIALTLAATVQSEQGDNIFIGEGVLYRFDGFGECEAAVRILPEHRGKGYSKEILRGLIEIGRSLGLLSVVARVRRENERALRLAASLMNMLPPGEDAEAVTFVLNF